MITAALVIACCQAPAPPPAATQPVVPPAQASPDPVAANPPPANPPPAAEVVRLLRDLEAGAADLRTFTASIHFETEDAFIGQKVIEKGRLVYLVEQAPTRKAFAILFDTTIEDRRKRERDRHYIYRDGWLVEIDHDARQFIKRQIVRPGEVFDPLKLGEGPIPLPIGQKADEVLARFEVGLIALPTEGPLRKLAERDGPIDGMRLIPREGTAIAQDYARIDLFYDRATRLPVGVNAIAVNGNRKTARLGDLRRNPVLSPDELAALDIEVPKGDWHVDVRGLAGP